MKGCAKYFFLGLLLVLLSCSQNNQENGNQTDETKQRNVLSKQDIESLKFTDYVLDGKAENALTSWQKYTELETLVNDVRNANLSFFKENKDVLKSFLDELKSTTPEVVNTPAIQARLKIIETMSYKLEDQLMLSQPKLEDQLNAVKGFLEAFSNLNFQINKKFERDSQNIERP